jgi:peptidoglycan-associated lipoprotein
MKAVPACAAAFAAGLMVACAPNPPVATPAPTPVARLSASHVVLMPDADGRVGQVVYRTAQGETVLTQANQATRLEGAAGNAYTVAAADIDKTFGRALAASPKAPRSFLLYFMAGGARLLPESEALFDVIKSELAARPVPDVSVIGHTDTAGDSMANERLGLALPDADGRAVSVESHGEKNLLIPTPDNTLEPRNRRVEVMIR